MVNFNNSGIKGQTFFLFHNALREPLHKEDLHIIKIISAPVITSVPVKVILLPVISLSAFEYSQKSVVSS